MTALLFSFFFSVLALKLRQSGVIRSEDILLARVYSGRLVEEFDPLVELNENIQRNQSHRKL